MLGAVADQVCGQAGDRLLVGVDGGAGSGKSTFADELARVLGERGVAVTRSTTDSFHRPRRERLVRGETSADGYYLDSHQLDRIADELLVPFRNGATEVLTSAFDEPTDTSAECVVEVDPQAVLVFDGLFLHRPEFAPLWDVSVYLDANERRDAAWMSFLFGELPSGSIERAAELDRRLELARWPRYRSGWRAYVDDVAPSRRATFVIDNNDLARPLLVDGE